MASHGMGESTINHKPSLKRACREHYSWHALHQQGLDTTTPAGKAMFEMLGVFAQHHPGTSPCGPSACQGTNLGRPSLPQAKDDGGRLWATRCEPRGALFQFTIPR
jgi:hypothetical protein